MLVNAIAGSVLFEGNASPAGMLANVIVVLVLFEGKWTAAASQVNASEYLKTLDALGAVRLVQTSALTEYFSLANWFDQLAVISFYRGTCSATKSDFFASYDRFLFLIVFLSVLLEQIHSCQSRILLHL